MSRAHRKSTTGARPSLRVQLALLAMALFFAGCANLGGNPKPSMAKNNSQDRYPIIKTPEVVEHKVIEQPRTHTNEIVVPTPTPAPRAPAPTPAPAPSTPQPNGENNVDSQRSTLLEADLNFSRVSEEKGAAQAFYEFLAPEGVGLFEGAPPIRGRDAIKIHLATGPQGLLTWQPTAADVARNGDMGYTWGTAIFQGKGPDDKLRIGHSKYISVWKKQTSGRWKVVLYSSSPSPPPMERQQ
jgi:ketosteroid isomerase-like protein